MSETFHYTVNGGPEKTIEVNTGSYVLAVAAIPAMDGIAADQFPLNIKIWMPSLLPEYGPYDYHLSDVGAPVTRLMQIGGQTVKVASYRD